MTRSIESSNLSKIHRKLVSFSVHMKKEIEISDLSLIKKNCVQNQQHVNDQANSKFDIQLAFCAFNSSIQQY